MRIQSRNLVAWSALLMGLDSSVAFSVTPTSITAATQTSTCLFLADEPQPPPQEEASSNEDAPSDDILSSPAFLKRKIDVLMSDIAKVDEDIALAKQRMEEGKAEWGGQLDELQKEVSANKRKRASGQCGLFALSMLCSPFCPYIRALRVCFS